MVKYGIRLNFFLNILKFIKILSLKSNIIIIIDIIFNMESAKHYKMYTKIKKKPFGQNNRSLSDFPFWME